MGKKNHSGLRKSRGKMGKINSFEAFVLCSRGINSKKEREMLEIVGNYEKIWHRERCQGLENGSEST